MMERPPRDPEHAMEDHMEITKECKCNMPFHLDFPDDTTELFKVDVAVIRATELEQRLSAELKLHQ